jgi:hypothetical protein
LAAAYNQLRGMLFIQNKPVTYVLSLLAIGFSFWWFFFRDNRVDTVMRHTSLEGAQQFITFCWTAFGALIFTLVAASLVHMLTHRPKEQCKQEERIEGAYPLRYMSFFEALKQSFRPEDKSDDGTHRPN